MKNYSLHMAKPRISKKSALICTAGQGEGCDRHLVGTAEGTTSCCLCLRVVCGNSRSSLVSVIYI